MISTHVVVVHSASVTLGLCLPTPEGQVCATSGVLADVPHQSAKRAGGGAHIEGWTEGKAACGWDAVTLRWIRFESIERCERDCRRPASTLR